MRDISLFYQGRYIENLDSITWPEVRIIDVQNTDIESFLVRKDYYYELVQSSYLTQMSNSVRVEKIDSYADVDFGNELASAMSWRITCEMVQDYEATMLKEIVRISLKLSGLHLLCFIPLEWENIFSELYPEPPLYRSWTGDDISVGLGFSFKYGRMAEVPYDCRIQKNGFTLRFAEGDTTGE